MELLPSTTDSISSWPFNRWAQASVTRPLGWAHSMYSGWESVVIWRLTLQSANTVRLTVWHYAKVSNEKWTACETVTVLSFNYLIVMQYYFRYLEIAYLSDSVSRCVIGKLNTCLNMPSIPEPSSVLVASTSDGSFMNNYMIITWSAYPTSFPRGPRDRPDFLHHGIQFLNKCR